MYCLRKIFIGPAIIQWSYRYSCWKLFALEMDTFLESVGSGTGEKCSCTASYMLLWTNVFTIIVGLSPTFTCTMVDYIWPFRVTNGRCLNSSQKNGWESHCKCCHEHAIVISFVHSALDYQNVVCIVELVKEILQNDWSKAVHLKPIIARLYMIIQR